MQQIELRGVRVHNLKNIDVDIPLGKLTVITGVSGSGKSSLAFDTLYAEGQRRYIESFSAYARRFLDRLDKPDADRIDHIPPAVALRQNEAGRRQRETIAAVTETDSYLRVLFARLGQLYCPTCNIPVTTSNAATIQQRLAELPPGRRIVVAFPVVDWPHVSTLQQSGFTRLLVVSRGEETAHSAEFLATGDLKPEQLKKSEVYAVVDRLVAGSASPERFSEAIESAQREGLGRCVAAIEIVTAQSETTANTANRRREIEVDGKLFELRTFSERLACEECGREFEPLEPALFHTRSPLGACHACHGAGQAVAVDWSVLVPDPEKTLADNALQLWADQRWRHERRRLLEFAEHSDIPVDRSFGALTKAMREALLHGSEESGFGGVLGFLKRLRRREHQESIRQYLDRWCELRECPDCDGLGLNAVAQAVRLQAEDRYADFVGRPIGRVLQHLTEWQTGLSEADLALVKHLLPELLKRLELLVDIGLGELNLQRPLSTLSRGEAQRATLVGVLATQLVNTLYVLDEPTAGLHPADVPAVVEAARKLRDAENTVVVIEHDPQFLQIADNCIEIGPGAGQDGGHLVYAGPAKPLDETAGSSDTSRPPRKPTGWIELHGATCHGRNFAEVRLPLGCLCIVTGLSGSGKSELVQGTLYPLLANRLAGTSTEPKPMIRQTGVVERITGAEQVEDVQLVDDSPLYGGQRSNPATWLKIFDEIRGLYADTAEAKQRGLNASYFSFNNDQGGRCPKCSGTGSIQIDMQFLADVVMTCPECRGTRFRADALEVGWRGMSISDVLSMTSSAAFTFFKGQPRLQKRLKSLKDVGLGYLTLGQPLNTLSGGEAQRLKLAAMLSRTSRSRSLLLMDEPTIGLHPKDVTRLLACFDDLLGVGHSLLVIEHDPQLLAAADCIIELNSDGATCVLRESEPKNPLR